ncbi:MAG: hypothetical protein WC471_02945 [Candidatus Woesearchaeota archaeon]
MVQKRQKKRKSVKINIELELVQISPEEWRLDLDDRRYVISRNTLISWNEYYLTCNRDGYLIMYAEKISFKKAVKLLSDDIKDSIR